MACRTFAALAAFACAGAATAPVAAATRTLAPPAAAAATLKVSLDGVNLGADAIARRAQPPLVPLEALAHAVGWRVRRPGNRVDLEGDDRALRLAIGARTVYENGEPRTVLSETPAERAGRLYVAMGDAARLFVLRASTRSGEVLFQRPVQIGSEAEIIDLARPPAPRPSPSPRAVRARPVAPNGAARAGQIVFSVNRVGRTKVLQLASETRGAYLETSLISSGIDALGVPNATVTLGDSDRNVRLGMLTDPLSGTIVHGGAYDGVSLYRSASKATLFAGRRLGTATSIAGLTLGDAAHGGANTFAMLRSPGGSKQAIVRHVDVKHRPWGDFSDEVALSSHGEAVGIAARTRGQTFVESALSVASQGFPLGPNDAPVTFDIGRHVSAATTVVGGLSGGRGQALAPFLGLSTRTGPLQGSVSLSDRTLTTSLSYQSERMNLQYYAVPGVRHSSGIQGLWILPAAAVELTAVSSAGSREAALQLRTNHPGVNLIAGVASPDGTRLGAVAGAAVPLGDLLALEGTVRPSAGGQTAVRLSLALGIPARRVARVPTLPASIRIANDAALPPLRLFVDGTPVRVVPSGAPLRVEVTPGAHDFAVETADGRFGSPEARAEIAAPGDGVMLTLWPKRVVSGRVRPAGEATILGDAGLSGMVVVAEPGGATAETRDDGSFVFPRQPFAPDTTLRLEPSSLPRGVRAPAPAALDGDDVEVVLLPALRVERQTFSASGTPTHR